MSDKTDYRGHLLGKCCQCRRKSITYLCDVCYRKEYRGEVAEVATYGKNPLYSPDDDPETKKIEMPHRSENMACRWNGIPFEPCRKRESAEST